jgi:hypothetical protein
LVIRSRLGDQVASATLVVIGKEADKGQFRAIKVREQVLDYIKCNPPKVEPQIAFGIDVPEKQKIIGDACILKRNLHTGKYTGTGLALLLLTLGEYSLGVLTHGPSLHKQAGAPNPIVCAVREALPNEKHLELFDLGNANSENKSIIDGVASNLDDAGRRALQLGMILGRARRLQAVAIPSVPLKILCEMTAWELGE